ncbi:calcium-binding protein [Phyllobacterium endophyticum]|uniref:Calcium-binding protein n=1 Tax=Phyllobacterium endophyticum TaxID=1149773 RepID=A0A2P7AKX3_9HYPH|nr:calcium-binding protein [Phyllobacterium endophyticum]MBB3233268.1 Ca2+-binding RTX toxin-like protein [Phyllobacterium endophyticum]PSH54844.1 hypothetical protein CU100_25040 [Phyllobacterium endophyticum]TYR43287.1 calcium-binding protein [Phyllobacterium endophyticum]
MAINLPNGLLQLLGIDPSTIEISLSEAGNSFNGSNANEHVHGNGGGDSINAGGGSDIVEGGTGGDSLNGQDGNDYIEGGVAGDAMNGGSGSDTLGYSQSGSSVRVTLNDAGGGTTSGSGSGPGNHAQGDSISGFENVVGSNFGDTLTGNIHRNVLAGLAGADKLYGMAGDDILVGGIGADVLDGGSGIDTADYSTSAAPVHLVLGGVSTGGDAQGDTLISIEKLVGTAGADVFDGSSSITGFSANGGGGADTMIGGHGNDTLSLGGAAAVAAFAALQEEGGGEVRGEDGNDNLTGSAGDDTIYDGAGDDMASGGEGKDTFIVGSGQNSLNGGNGDDSFSLQADSIPASSDGSITFDGGEGPQDSMDLRNLSSGAEVTLQDPSASLAALEDSPYLMDMNFGGETSSYFRASIETDTLTEFDDGFFGNSRDNTVFGEGGNDLIDGGGGNDTLIGGNGNDLLYAGFGAGGNETLYGGFGADRFVFASVEELSSAFTFIQDFFRGEDDVINLSLIDANTTTEEDAFVWVGSVENLTGAAGELAFISNSLEGYNTIVGEVNGEQGNDIAFLVNNTDGDPTADFFVL